MSFTGEALGKSSLVPVPYEWIQKDPSCVVAHGLPEGVTLKKPSEYDTKTLMKILEQSHRIQFTVKRLVCGGKSVWDTESAVWMPASDDETSCFPYDPKAKK